MRTLRIRSEDKPNGRPMKIDISFFIIVGCGIFLLYWIVMSLQ